MAATGVSDDMLRAKFEELQRLRPPSADTLKMVDDRDRVLGIRRSAAVAKVAEEYLGLKPTYAGATVVHPLPAATIRKMLDEAFTEGVQAVARTLLDNLLPGPVKPAAAAAPPAPAAAAAPASAA